MLSINKFITSPAIKKLFPDLAELYNKIDKLHSGKGIGLIEFHAYYLVNNYVIFLRLANSHYYYIDAYCSMQPNSLGSPKNIVSMNSSQSVDDFATAVLININAKKVESSYPLFIQAIHRILDPATNFWMDVHSFVTCVADAAANMQYVNASGIFDNQSKGNYFDLKTSTYLVQGSPLDLGRNDYICKDDSQDVSINTGSTQLDGWTVEIAIAH